MRARAPGNLADSDAKTYSGIALALELTGVSSLFVPMLAASVAALVPALLGNSPIYDSLRDRALLEREPFMPDSAPERAGEKTRPGSRG